MTRTIQVGRMRLASIPGGDVEDGTVQVASGVDMHGVDVVLVRAGVFILALEPAAARNVGAELIAEADRAAVSSRRPE